MAAVAAAAVVGWLAVPPAAAGVAGTADASGIEAPAPATRSVVAGNRVVDTVLRAQRYDYRPQDWRVRDAEGLPRWLRVRQGRLSGTAPRLGTWRVRLVERGVRRQRGEVRRTSLVVKVVTPRAARGTVLVTRGRDGRPANGWSGDATVSGDGRTVVFSSMATNLVVGTQQAVARLYTWDAATRRVSLLHPEAWARVEGLSHDGSKVLLDLTAGLFLLDRTRGSLTQVAPRAVGADLTDDGARVLYQDRGPELASPAPRLLEWAVATGGSRTVVADLQTRRFAGMSGDARHVLLVGDDRSTLLDTATGAASDLGRLGTELGNTQRADVSLDGRLVAVTGTGLPAGSGHGGRAVGGVHDALLGTSRGPAGDNLGAAITADGSHYAVATDRRPLRIVQPAEGRRHAAFVARPSSTVDSVSLSDGAARVAYVSDAHDVLRGTRRGVANVFIWTRAG